MMGILDLAEDAAEVAVPQVGIPAQLLKHWKLIVGAVGMLALGIYIMVLRAEVSHWRKLDTQHVAALNLEIAKHAVTRASLVQALSSIDDQNRAVDALKGESDARTQAAHDALAAAQKAAQSAQGAIKALEVSAAKAAPAGSCKASAAYLAAKGDL